MTSKIRCRYCVKPFLNRDKLANHLKYAQHKFMYDGCDKWFKEPIKRKMIGEFAFCPKCYKRQSTMPQTTYCPEHCPLCKGIIAPVIEDNLNYWCGNCRLKFHIVVIFPKGDRGN